MKEFLRSLFQKDKQKGILIDTNILLLWFVGSVNRSRISQFNRTEQFLPEDYDLLIQILSYFSKIITTPNILTEVNSLLNQLGEPERSQCFSIFAQFFNRLDEFYLESKNAASMDNFNKYGLTDSGIVMLAKNQYLVLTDDFKLANYLQKIGVDTINFNNIRTYGW
ncbi:MAG: PIN domain-containing protein [Rhizonema sp. NSF051]|nr:PIN domain-containing protein [Rhizonema sp. NSF051]